MCILIAPFLFCTSTRFRKVFIEESKKMASDVCVD